MKSKITKEKLKNMLPGMRVIKTFLAILICVSIDYFRGAVSPFQSSIATLICLRPTVKSTFEASKSRILGTLLSGLYTGVFLISIRRMNIIETSYLYYFLVAIFSLLLMSIFVAAKKPDALSIGIVVFLVISFTVYKKEPIAYTTSRVIDTLVGIFVAILVNWLPFLNIHSPEVIQDEIVLNRYVTLNPDVHSDDGFKIKFTHGHDENEDEKPSRK